MLLQADELTIADFSSSNSENWIIINDGVMGGLSQSSIEFTDDNTAIFKGRVRLENNGGFASVRYNPETITTEQFTHISLKIKGDGKKYQFRLKSDQREEYAYVQTFQTTGEWEEIKLPLTDFYPSYRGRKLRIPNFNGPTIEEIAFLIANKKEENFEIEIDKISLI